MERAPSPHALLQVPSHGRHARRGPRGDPCAPFAGNPHLHRTYPSPLFAVQDTHCTTSLASWECLFARTATLESQISCHTLAWKSKASQPFACCVGSLRSVGRCGRCSCRCRFRVRGAQRLQLVLGLCWWWRDVSFARQRRPVVGVLRLCWLLWGSFECFCCPHTSVLRPSTTCLAVFACA